MNDTSARGRSGHGDAPLWDLGDSLGALTNIAARLFQRALHERLQRYGTAFGQWPILVMLWHEDGQPQRELSRHIGVEAPTLTRTIDRMVRDGHVRRQRNPRDRREVLIFLTEQGRRLKDDLIPEAMALNALAGDGMAPAEQEELKRLLRILIARLIAAGLSRPADIPECIRRIGDNTDESP